MLDCYRDDYGVSFDPRYFPVTPEEYRKLTSNGTDVDLNGYYTSGQTDELLALKQNLISDLDVIRSGATLGATALQSVPSEYITDTELGTALLDYYTTGDTYTKTEVNNLIHSSEKFHYEIYANLSGVTDPKDNVLYLIGPSGTGSDKYEEYVYANNAFTKIGDTTIDLTDYATITALTNGLAAKSDTGHTHSQYSLTSHTHTEYSLTSHTHDQYSLTSHTHTAQDIGALPSSTTIPSTTSQLTNDSGFITGYTETDPTVPAWAKESTKPTYSVSEISGLQDALNVKSNTGHTHEQYSLTSHTHSEYSLTSHTHTAAEVGALPDTTSIPNKTSDLTNDSGFITGFTETDPTVPAWAKESTKPTYTASEVGAAATVHTHEISDVSGLTEALSGIVVDLLQEVTYSELKLLRDNGELVPGQLYRITDYVATTTQEGTRSAGHAFDIIIIALSNSELSEEAKAIAHSGDTYFANCELSAWELKYCLDNDTSRFAWADETNGKGVVYYMKDELCNECAYDFKNIQFELVKLLSVTWNETVSGNTDFTETIENNFVGKYVGSWFAVNNAGTINFDDNDKKFFYTFSLGLNDGNYDYGMDDDEIVDGSMKINESNAANIYRQNIIPEYIPADDNNSQKLNYIVFKPFNGNSDDCCCNIFGENNYNTVLNYSWTVYNKFGNDVHHNTIGNNVYRNTIGNSFQNNTIGNSFQYNTIGNNVYYNTIGNGFNNNSIGNNFGSNTIGNGFYQNSIGNGFNNNSIGNEFNSNTIGNYFYQNSIGNDFQYNRIGEGVQYLDFTTNYGSVTLQYLYVLSGYKYNNKTSVPTGITANATYSQTIGFNTAGSFVVKNMLD